MWLCCISLLVQRDKQCTNQSHLLVPEVCCTASKPGSGWGQLLLVSDKCAGTVCGNSRRQGGSNYLNLTTIYTGAGSHSVKYPNIYSIISIVSFGNYDPRLSVWNGWPPKRGHVIPAAAASLALIPNITSVQPWPLTSCSKFPACSGTPAPRSRGTWAAPLIAYPRLCKDVRGIAIGASYKFVDLTSGLEEDQCQGI